MFISCIKTISGSKCSGVKIATVALLICVSIIVNIYAANPYSVHTIYFMPKDSQDHSELLDLDDMMKSIQLTYQLEMERNGFGPKTFELETDKNGKVIVHKVRGNSNKAAYFSKPASIVMKELEQKGFNNKHTIYAIIMAGIEIFAGGGTGVAVALPWGGWYGNGNSQYSGYAISTDRGRNRIESIIRHELGHTFGLSHFLYHRGDYYNSIMNNARGDNPIGQEDQLTHLEARWLSKIRHFNGDQPFRNNFAPRLSKFDGAFRVGENIMLKATFRDLDNDGIFQAYGLVDWWVIGWDIFDGNSDVEHSLLRDIPDELLKSGKIAYFFMDIHGNWMYDFPDKVFTLPEKVNKENLGKDQNPIEDCPGCKVDPIDDTPRSINSKSKLTTSWAAIKSR